MKLNIRNCLKKIKNYMHCDINMVKGVLDLSIFFSKL